MIKINDDTQTGSQASKIAALETSASNLASSFTQLNNGLGGRVTSLETSFPAGCNTIMQAVTAKGVTPASNSPSDISTAISNISTGIDIGDALHINNLNIKKIILFFASTAPTYADSNNSYMNVSSFYFIDFIEFDITTKECKFQRNGYRRSEASSKEFDTISDYFKIYFNSNMFYLIAKKSLSFSISLEYGGLNSNSRYPFKTNMSQVYYREPTWYARTANSFFSTKGNYSDFSTASSVGGLFGISCTSYDFPWMCNNNNVNYIRAVMIK